MVSALAQYDPVGEGAVGQNGIGPPLAWSLLLANGSPKQCVHSAPNGIHIPDREDPPTPLANTDNCAMLHIKEETDAMEETLHNLMHLCHAVTQRDHLAKGSTYDLFRSIPSGPNMGHRHLCGDLPENAAIMAHESALFNIFLSLKHLDNHPSLEVSRLQLLALVENEIHRIDSIWQAAWNRSADGKDDPDIGKSRRASGVSVNTAKNVPTWYLLKAIS
ncbi:hypothetical protein M404DRAFT_8746 [Pisolithus tinctorius Marx 270]|uniref:Uncharacterized protein n=1 Tax=Pisolithus tinctorius Marx 270 TaxID=870435 RepID=A0A0C3PDP0_PISTI|nr:hypothetical protein M404DRAFT_8746 [Pisolithus tinctorius Marx 270]